MDIANYQAAADSLEDRIIMITGATRGIGKALAVDAAKLGATILLIAKDLKRLEQTYDEIAALGKAQPAMLNIDLESAGADDYQTVANSVREEYGRIDGLVHNAARVGGLTPLHQTDVALWSKLVTLHIHAPFLLTRACLPLLKQSKDPSIIFSIDEASKAYWGAYGVSKAGQASLMNILAEELDGDQKIRVNGIHPGPVRTHLRTHNYPGLNPNEFPAAEDVTAPYLYFLSDDSKEITAQLFRV
jgi:NAD(P)-dependent dehydrogenase (short-subunit alcohol dehydrogenase family)